MPDRILLRCHNLSHAYQEARHTTPVLHEISLQLQPAALVALVGSSGSGKSTLLHLLGGLLQPTSGEIFFQEQPLHQLSATVKARLRNRSLGFIYQFHHLLPDFTAWENVALPLLIAGEGRAAARFRALALLAQVGLQQRCDHRPAALSGGERQRVAIARALVNRPALVLADEPTGALDRHNAQELLALMLQFNASLGTAFLVATHDLTLAGALQQQWQLCDGVLQAPAAG